MKNDKKTEDINAASGASSADEGEPVPDITNSVIAAVFAGVGIMAAFLV